jgi:hypothetical protein
MYFSECRPEARAQSKTAWMRVAYSAVEVTGGRLTSRTPGSG